MFHFKQFSIANSRASMKVGTDAVLLGVWAPLEHETRILDIGTGSGILALMMAQRTENCPIDAVELNHEAAHEAKENIKNCRWKDRIQVFDVSFQQFAAKCLNRYSLIISNPPFFSKSLKAPDNARNMARHNDWLPVGDLLSCTSNLLNERGKAVFIIPTDALENWISEAEKVALFPAQIVRIKSTQAVQPHRILILFTQSVKEKTYIGELCIYSSKSEYSSEYEELTKDFYLNF